MNLHTDPKNKITQQLRQLIRQQIPEAQETDRAAANTCTLSFQSTTYPERHVWIDTNVEGIEIDLEDWNDENEWDNAVTRLSVDSIQAAAATVKNWLLSGNPTSLLDSRQHNRSSVA